MGMREDMMEWVLQELRGAGGKASVLQLAKLIWERHEQEIRASGDALYTWQYDMRWAAWKLRKQGQLAAAGASPKGIWSLK